MITPHMPTLFRNYYTNTKWRHNACTLKGYAQIFVFFVFVLLFSYFLILQFIRLVQWDHQRVDTHCRISHLSIPGRVWQHYNDPRVWRVLCGSYHLHRLFSLFSGKEKRLTICVFFSHITFVFINDPRVWWVLCLLVYLLNLNSLKIWRPPRTNLYHD